MSKQTDLREIQRLTEDAAIDARKLLIQADNLPPGTFQKMLEELCGSFEDTALQLRRLCEQQSPGTGGYKRGRALRPLEVVGSVERIGIDWLHIRINTLLPHCRFQPPAWLTETLVELLDAYEACGVQDCSFNYRSAPLFPQKAVRLYEDIVKFVTEAVICARTMEVWLLEDLTLAIVSNYSVLSGGEFTTEYRTVKAWEFQKGLLCIEPDTLTEKLMELCAPFYSHYDQTYYEL